MAINKFRVFTLDRILIYLGACFAFPFLACAQAVRYNYFQHNNGLPVGGWIAMISALLGFALGDFMLFWDRYKFKKTIWGYTSQGVGIIKPTYEINNEPSFDAVCAQVDAAAEFNINFWGKEYPTYDTDIQDGFNGAFIGFTGQKIELDTLTLSSVATPGKFAKFAVGITSGNDCLVMWQPTEDFAASVKNRVIHEFGHVALNAAAVNQDGPYQHIIMAKDGFNY